MSRSFPDEVNVEMDVLVKEEPRVEGEELTENDYHQLDPLTGRPTADPGRNPRCSIGRT